MLSCRKHQVAVRVLSVIPSFGSCSLSKRTFKRMQEKYYEQLVGAMLQLNWTRMYHTYKVFPKVEMPPHVTLKYGNTVLNRLIDLGNFPQGFTYW